MQIKEWLLAEFDHEIGATRRVLERIGDDRLAWAPHDRSRTAGALATHVANLPTWTAAVLEQPFLELTTVPPPLTPMGSRGDILQHFDLCASRARPLLDRGDSVYASLWTLRREGHEIFTVPRLMAFRSFVLNHIIHHRGQLTVYLRLL
ncbi:MAG: DinB family protein, partial [Vicinamibacterales bacterium]